MAFFSRWQEKNNTPIKQSSPDSNQKKAGKGRHKRKKEKPGTFSSEGLQTVDENGIQDTGVVERQEGTCFTQYLIDTQRGNIEAENITTEIPDSPEGGGTSEVKDTRSLDSHCENAKKSQELEVKNAALQLELNQAMHELNSAISQNNRLNDEKLALIKSKSELEGNLTLAENDRDQLKLNLQSIQNDKDIYSRRVENLELKIVDLQREKNSLLISLTEEKSTSAAKHSAWQEVSTELAQLRNEWHIIADDQQLEVLWTSLQHSVQDFAATYFAGIQGTKPPAFSVDGFPDEDTLWRLKSLTRDLEYSLNDARRRPLIIQAYVWRILCEHVFAVGSRSCNEGLYWAAGKGRDFQSLREIIKPVKQRRPENLSQEKRKDFMKEEVRRLADFHRWRATTSRLLLENLKLVADSRVKRERRNALVTQIRDAVWHLQWPKNTYQDQNTLSAAMDDSLRKVVDKAVEVDQTWHQQLTPFELEFPNEGNREYGFVSGEGEVELIISPGVYIIGSPNGDFSQDRYGKRLLHPAIFKFLELEMEKRANTNKVGSLLSRR